mmetsp:Transcript_11885/g.18016  ORF Transcript_11885/g.18016 Transcript_11885/m.18016 type:complete len:201 (+) Transcript_11885:173-775(+)
MSNSPLTSSKKKVNSESMGSMEEKQSRFKESFRINSTTMKDGETRELLWEYKSTKENEWQWKVDNNEVPVGGEIKDGKEKSVLELEARLPANILQRNVVSREINFSSKNEIKNLRLIQCVKLNDAIIEEWNFRFGFVVPGSTNAWEQQIQSATKTKTESDDPSPSPPMDAKFLSGNVTIDTYFYDGDDLMATKCMRIYYD